MRGRRGGLLLILFLLFHLAVLASQSEESLGGGVIGRTALRLTAPLTRVVDGVSDFFARLGSSLRSWGQLRQENQNLREEVAELRYRLLWRRGLEGQLERLGEALDYRRSEEQPLTIAEVVLADSDAWFGSLIVFAPESDLAVDQPVIVPQGVVGRIIQVSGPYAKVQILTDRNAAAGARIERTRRQGMAVGLGDERLALRMVPRQEDVRVGDRVVTSGTDGIYPPDLLIGTVGAVELGPQMLLDIQLIPAVGYRALEQVFILPRREIPSELRGREMESAARSDESN